MRSGPSWSWLTAGAETVPPAAQIHHHQRIAPLLPHEQLAVIATECNAFHVIEADEERVAHLHPAFEIQTKNRLGVISDGVQR